MKDILIKRNSTCMSYLNIEESSSNFKKNGICQKYFNIQSESFGKSR